jgi:hypothetical protein
MGTSGRARLGLLLPLALALSGCPLVSDLPLSDPASARIDEELLGTWEAPDPDSGETRLFRLTPYDEHEVLGQTIGEGAGPEDSFRLFSTRIEGLGFLNVRELGKGAMGWYILRYAITGDMVWERSPQT